MQFAKNFIDLGLSKNNLEPMLRLAAYLNALRHRRTRLRHRVSILRGPVSHAADLSVQSGRAKTPAAPKSQRLEPFNAR
jgi:hypothetical protein